MASTDLYSEETAIDPIDIVECLAGHHGWDFDRVEDNQIAMAITGQWRTYSITLAWSPYDETLRLICTFELEPPEERLNDLFAGISLVNSECWSGAFTFWTEQQLMVWRYGLILSGGQIATPDQIETMINAAVFSAERFYPAFQLMVWSEKTPAEAMDVAIAEAYGRA